jgi:hypothetical protein
MKDLNNKVEMNKEVRILARQVAEEVKIEDLEKVTGGTTSCSCGCADDCDQMMME